MNNKSSAIQKIVEEGTWYHSIAIENLKSKGTFDYSNLVNKLNFPRMDNLNVLDVGCSDGFFSIYFLNNLGAKEVTGVDFNDYDGKVAFEVLKSYKELKISVCPA